MAAISILNLLDHSDAFDTIHSKNCWVVSTIFGSNMD